MLLLFLWRGRAPAVYAGVFFAVAFLEIYGTAVGTWRWAAEVPGLGVPDGNPPSGAASGYVFFDIAALALAPWLLLAWRRLGAAAVPAPGGRAALAAPPLHSLEVAGQSITGEISLLWQDRDPYTGDVLLMSLDTDEPFRMNTFEIRGGLAERLKDGVLAEGMRVRVECRAETDRGRQPGERRDVRRGPGRGHRRHRPGRMRAAFEGRPRGDRCLYCARPGRAFDGA